MPAQPKNYVAIAKRYAEGVVSGKILACEWVKKACQRQLDDLARVKTDREWPYVFNPQSKSADASPREKLGPGNYICQFVEQMPHIKGDWANSRRRLILEPWQIFIYTTVFGWVYRKAFVDQSGKDLSGKRRFRTAYLEMGRKNGKSTLSAPMGLYMMCADGEAGAEVYCAATTREQTRAVWLESAKPMVEHEAGFRRAFGVETSAHSIYRTSTNSFFRPLCAEGNSLDSLNIHCAIIDELHAHRKRKVYDVLASARGARLQPLLWLITTAGFDRSGICYEQRSYVTKILDGVTRDETYFGIIYTLDEKDDWRDERNWGKPNPNLDISVYSKELRAEAAKAAAIPSALNNYLTKYMSVWVNASVALFDIRKWQALANPSLEPEDFKDDPCWIGLDFAPLNDFTSRVQLFRREEEDGIHYFAFARHFLSEGKVEESENSQYAGWVRDGWIHTNPGNQTDDRELEDDVVALLEDGYQVREIDCDPSRLQGTQTRIAERTGATVVDVPQNRNNLSAATELLGALIADGKIHHNGDPVLTWMLSNVVSDYDRGGRVYPGKESAENKNDGAIALITALSRAMSDCKSEPKFQMFFLGGGDQPAIGR